MQRLLSSTLLLTPMTEPATPAAAAAALAMAGVYELDIAQSACLRVCRSPLAFLMQHWRPAPPAHCDLGPITASAASAADGR